MPTGRWLRSELGEVVRDALLDEQSLSAQGLFARELTLLLDEHARGAANHRQRLWSLYVLEQWQRAQLRRHNERRRTQERAGDAQKLKAPAPE